MASPDTNTSDFNAGADATQRSSGVMGRVRENASAQLSTQKDKATEGLGSVAQAVRQSTQQLREQQHETIAGYVESAADQIERFSQRLREKDIGELLEDAQRLARRQPAAVIGSAFAIGLLGVRFFKSSARRDRDFARYGSASSYPRDEYRSTTGTSYTSQAHERSTSGADVSSGTTVGREGYTGGTAGAFADDPSTTSTGANAKDSTAGRGSASAGTSRRPRGSKETERS